MKAKLPKIKKDKNEAIMNSPCTIAEAVQLARGVAEDVVVDYERQKGHLQVALSLQIETLKKLLFSAGIIDEEDFREEYMAQAEEFNNMQRAAMREESEDVESPDPSIPKTDVKVDDIEIKKI